ncbi:NIPSNAP family protein [Yinghuangia sp. YIM S09857]|uniref:NIPSNAP family protein n=1 Tax=Yinghuangia sp. YIM S09857 TaxID=3436929 RepID=UPI003F53CA99
MHELDGPRGQCGGPAPLGDPGDSRHEHPPADPIVELRQYTLRPGARETLITLFEREFVTGQEAVGMRLGGRFRDLGAPDRFVWLRSFPDMDARARQLAAFYDGPVWARHREAANATMLDSDDVLLLRGPEVRVPEHAALVTVVVCHPRDPAAFPGVFETRVRPALTARGAAPLAVLRTEHAPNTYPRLPVREGEDVFVWCIAHPESVVDPEVDAVHGASEIGLSDADLLHTPQVLRLSPVRTA